MLGYEDVDDLLGKPMHKLIHHSRAGGDSYSEDERKAYQAFEAGVGTAHRRRDVMVCGWHLIPC